MIKKSVQRDSYGTRYLVVGLAIAPCATMALISALTYLRREPQPVSNSWFN
jgi:hypothetical protein